MQNKHKEKIDLIPGLCMSMGIIKSLYSQNGQMQLSHMPYALNPYHLYSSTYQRIIKLHILWQKLIAKIAIDKDFLGEVAKEISFEDQYMKRLMNIFQKYYQIQKPQAVCVRVDYMGDDDPKLVQFNLMAVGLNGISDRVQNLTSIIKAHPSDYKKVTYPNNRNQQVICEAFIKCLQLCDYNDGYVMMVTHKGQFNFGDQNSFKLQMLKKGRIVICATFDELVQGLKIEQQTKIASFKEKRIDAFYFRTGYAPKHFNEQKYWKLKEDIERSIAIKMPSITMMIINSKTMQAKLSNKQILSKYLDDDQIKQLASLHGQIYQLSKISQQQADRLQKKMSEKDYVLKPNREGGGNNFFGIEALNKFKQLRKQNKLYSYILMSKIQCQSQPNTFIAEFNHFQVPQAQCQYSTFGSMVYYKGETQYNQCGGSLMRLKKAELNEGGIAINQGAITGIFLIQQ